MSLLNDALRSAEQRRKPPSAPAAYPGQTAPEAGETSNAFALLLAVAVLATLAAFVFLWLWLKPDPEQMEPPVGAPFAESAVTGPEPIFEQRATNSIEVATKETEVAEAESIEAQAPKPVPELADAIAPPPPSSSPEPAIAATSEPNRLSVVTPPETAENGRNNSSFEPASAPDAPRQEAERKMSGEQAPAEPAPAVRQQRETPELADRRAEKSIRQALYAGRYREAEAMLSDILANQPAPLSRARLSRHLLVNERPEQALTWLTQEAASTDDTLRLLRARALLASGQAEDAVTLLESNVPGVGQNAEYTVTLATLLQQQGRANDAAGRWAELIAHDDAKAVWWVGLAIALEADQQFRAATRAFEQAMLLPDLPPSLTDYVRRRLTEQGAG